MSDCQQHCPQNCYDDQYHIIPSVSTPKQRNEILLHVIHNKQVDDLVIEHMPDLNVIVLLANLGGVAGLWLGISILTILDYAALLVKHNFYFINIFKNRI